MSLADVIKDLEERFFQEYANAKNNGWDKASVEQTQYAYEQYRSVFRNANVFSNYWKDSYKQITNLWMTDIVPRYNNCGGSSE